MQRRHERRRGRNSMRAKKPSSFVICPVLVALGATTLIGCGGRIASDPMASEGQALSSKCPPSVPSPALAVPDGNTLAFNFDAIGVQIYACTATATGFAWVFHAPEANLYNP